MQNIFDSRCRILVLIIVLFTGFVVSVSAVDYNPGVSVGQYVKYGNYWAIGDPAFVSSVLQMDWLKYEVTNVNGKDVTIASSWAPKNGTATGGSSVIYNVEAGTMSTQYANNTEYLNGPIIAGNLSAGDMIPPLGYLKVNKTETLVYLGASRTVNIVNSTSSDPQTVINEDLVYDKVTGWMLEFRRTSNQTQPTSRYIAYGCSVIETNITGEIIPEFTPLPVFMTAAAFVALIAALSPKRNRRSGSP